MDKFWDERLIAYKTPPPQYTVAYNLPDSTHVCNYENYRVWVERSKGMATAIIEADQLRLVAHRFPHEDWTVSACWNGEILGIRKCARLIDAQEWGRKLVIDKKDVLLINAKRVLEYRTQFETVLPILSVHSGRFEERQAYEWSRRKTVTVTYVGTHRDCWKYIDR